MKLKLLSEECTCTAGIAIPMIGFGRRIDKPIEPVEYNKRKKKNKGRNVLEDKT